MTALQDLRKRFEPQLRRVFHLYWRFARGMTLGVRGVVLDGENRVFLVKHSYVSGWHLPGGGVEVGESFIEALRRELMEEGRVEMTAEPALHGMRTVETMRTVPGAVASLDIRAAPGGAPRRPRSPP